MLPTASGRWILVYEGCKHSVGANIPFTAKSFLRRPFCGGARLVGALHRRSAFRFTDTRSTQGCVEQATCWLGRSVALPIPNLSDASFDELEWLFLVGEQPLHLDKYDRLMRVVLSRTSRPRSDDYRPPRCCTEAVQFTWRERLRASTRHSAAVGPTFRHRPLLAGQTICDATTRNSRSSKASGSDM